MGLIDKPGVSLKFSICISCFSGTKFPSPESGVCMVDDGQSVRGDLCGGAVLGLVDEHLFFDCGKELYWIK